MLKVHGDHKVLKEFKVLKVLREHKEEQDFRVLEVPQETQDHKGLKGGQALKEHKVQ